MASYPIASPLAEPDLSIEEAAEVLEPLVEEIPNDERYPAALAWAYAGLGMRGKAVREAERAVGTMPRERDRVF